MNPTELNYQAVSTFDGGCTQRLAGSRTEFRRMEPGKKYRQFLAGVLGINITHAPHSVYLNTRVVARSLKC